MYCQPGSRFSEFLAIFRTLEVVLVTQQPRTVPKLRILDSLGVIREKVYWSAIARLDQPDGGRSWMTEHADFAN